MTPHTAKTIKELTECLCNLWGGGGSFGVYTVALQRERLEGLLHELVEAVKQETIEP